MDKEFKGLRFKRLKDMVLSEQYLIFTEKSERVGHVSLRRGLLVCHYLSENNEILYHFNFFNKLKSRFANEAERNYYLRICAHCIRKRMEKEDD